MPRGPGSKEIDRETALALGRCANVVKIFCVVLCAELKRRRQRAQDSGDISEEAKICNAIGDLYLQTSMSTLF